MGWIGNVLFIMCLALPELTSGQIQFPGFRNPGSRPGNQPNFRPGSLQNNRPGILQNNRPGILQNNRPGSQQNSGAVNSFGNRLTSTLNNLNSEFHDIKHPPNASVSTQHFQEFRYSGPLGTENWSTLFPSCSGVSQSPIAIDEKTAKKDKFEPFVFKHYELLPAKATITNNGHTAMITLPNGATLSGGGLPGEFEFLNLHFHWGTDTAIGSEHSLNGITYPLELHLVHWNYNYFSSEEALSHPDGIAVLAVLFYVDPVDNPFMEPIMESLSSVVTSGSSKDFKPNFRLSNFLPQNRKDFYRYNGSLTTPACRESVIWTVFANPIPISERQLNEFRNLLNPENKARTDNHRPVQPLNTRILYRNEA